MIIISRNRDNSSTYTINNRERKKDNENREREKRLFKKERELYRENSSSKKTKISWFFCTMNNAQAYREKNSFVYETKQI
jgi:hypothetical protein